MLKPTRSFYYITNSCSTGDIHKILYCIYISRLFLTSLFGHLISILGCLSFISILVVLRQSSIIPSHYRIIAEEDYQTWIRIIGDTLVYSRKVFALGVPYRILWDSRITFPTPSFSLMYIFQHWFFIDNNVVDVYIQQYFISISLSIHAHTLSTRSHSIPSPHTDLYHQITFRAEQCLLRFGCQYYPFEKAHLQAIMSYLRIIIIAHNSEDHLILGTITGISIRSIPMFRVTDRQGEHTLVLQGDIVWEFR